MATKKITKTSVKTKKIQNPDKDKIYVEMVLKKIGALDSPRKNRYDYSAESLEDISCNGYVRDQLYDCLEQTVIDADQSLTEQGTFEILKNNKKIQERFDKILKILAINIVEETSSIAKEFEMDRIANEKQAKKDAEREAKHIVKIEAEEKIRKEKERKRVAEKSILKESLTASQKRTIKKLSGVDIDRM